MHNNSIFAIRTSNSSSYFNSWKEAIEKMSHYDEQCIDEIYLNGYNEPFYEYKIGSQEFTMSKV